MLSKTSLIHEVFDQLGILISDLWLLFFSISLGFFSVTFSLTLEGILHFL